MKLLQTENGFELRSYPGCLWVVGGFFAAAGAMLLIGMLGGFSNYAELERWEIVVGIAMAIVFLVAGAWVVWSHPAMITRIDLPKRSITIVEQRFVTSSTTELPFSELAGFENTEEQDSDGDSFFHLSVRKHDGDLIRLCKQGVQVADSVRETAAELNRLLADAPADPR